MLFVGPHPHAVEHLVEIAQIAQDPAQGGQVAFATIAEQRANRVPYLKYLGRAFGTKFLFFLFVTTGDAEIVLSSSQYSGSPTLADSLLLPAIAAVIVGGSAITGGIGGPLRTVVGALIIGVLRVGMSILGVPPAYVQIVYGALIVIAVALSMDRSRVRVVK